MNCIIKQFYLSLYDFFNIYVTSQITSYQLIQMELNNNSIHNTLYNFLSMIQSVNQNLKNYVPGYQRAVNLSMKGIQTTKTAACSVIDFSQKRVQLVKTKTLSVKQKWETQISKIILSSVQQALNTVENYVYQSSQLPSQQEKKQLRKRLEKFYKKIINAYIYTYAQKLQGYNLALVKKGKQYVYVNLLPLYIHLKATLIVTKQLMIEMLESRLDGMKMTYSVSKDTVTMIIGGKFDQQKIIQKVSEGMDNFKDLTVKVVKRGLQIKVDKKSLYQNYQTFSLKLLQVMRQMRQKSAESIVTVRQKTSQLYKSVINRIKQRQVLLKMQYKEIEDKKE